jgi:hypothetical protein
MSTFSPSLRIELIDTGAQAGVWGTTTNTNLGTLIESAIAGYVSVLVTSANQAFTALNGAADQSRNMSIALTTSTTDVFNVYAPPVEKTYILYNASAYTATIYNSTVQGNTTAAGAGVAIPAGKTMTVWSEGTNFQLQNTHFVGTVVGNVTGDVTGDVTGELDGSITGTTTGVTQAPGNSTARLATTAFVTAALQAVYPVGSIYINAGVSTNPATLLGFGTWAAFGAGRVMVGLNGADPLFDALEETGGSKDAIVVSHNHTATSTVADPGHRHNTTLDAGLVATNAAYEAQAGRTTYSSVNGGYETYHARGTADSTQANASTSSTSATGITVGTTIGTAGSSGTNANLQPYITVAMWKRTA